MSRPTLVFAAGFLAGAGIAAAVVSATGGGATAPTDDALMRRLDLIEAQVRFVGTSIADMPDVQLPEPRAEVEPTPLADPRLDDILARLDALQSELKKLTDAGGEDVVSAEPEAAAPPVPRGVEPLPDALPDAPPDLGAFALLTGRTMDELGQQHQFWTYAKVGEAYGRPTRVAPSPGGVGIKYYYELPDGREFIFWFTDGKVIGAFWGDE